MGRSSEVTNVKDDARFATSTDRDDTNTPGPHRTPATGDQRRKITAASVRLRATEYRRPAARGSWSRLSITSHPVVTSTHVKIARRPRGSSGRPSRARPGARRVRPNPPRHPRQRNKAKHNQSIIEWPINGHVPGCNATHRIATHEMHDGPRRRAHTDTHAVRNTQRQDARSLDRVMTSPRGALNATALPWHTVPRRHPAPHTLTRAHGYRPCLEDRAIAVEVRVVINDFIVARLVEHELALGVLRELVAADQERLVVVVAPQRLERPACVLHTDLA